MYSFSVHYFVFDNVTVNSFDVIDPDVNFSDHLPIICDFFVVNVCAAVTFNGQASSTTTNEQAITTLSWDHADLPSYYNYTGYWLRPLADRLDAVTASLDKHDDIDFKSVISEIYTSIVSVLNTGASCFVPRRTNNRYKFWWVEEFSSLKEDSIEW